MTTRTDEQLMLAYQQGDFEAFAQLYERYSGRVYGYLRKRIPEPAQREDIFQTVFLKLHKSRHRYDPKFPFAPWLFTLCRNSVIDAARNPSHRPTSELDENIAAPPQEDGREIEMAKISQANRELLDMRYSKEMSFEQISIQLGISEPAVRKRVSRAIQTLKTRLAGKGEG